MEWAFQSDKGWEGLELGLQTGQECGARLPAPGAFLARNPHFSAVLAKQKSAKERAARQSGELSCCRVWGLSLLRWQSDSLLCGLGSPCRKGLCPPPRQQGLVSQSLDTQS